MESKIVVCLLMSAFLTLIIISLINILITKNVKCISFVFLVTCSCAVFASVQELGIIWRIINKSSEIGKGFAFFTILICIVIYWIPIVCGVLYKKRKLSQMKLLDEFEVMKIKDL